MTSTSLRLGSREIEGAKLNQRTKGIFPLSYRLFARSRESPLRKAGELGVTLTTPLFNSASYQNNLRSASRFGEDGHRAI